MQTLALVIMATATSLLPAIPLGILAAKSNTVSATIRPVLDLVQTMPAFVYLIPAITSIEELPQHADELGGKVYTIEPGAGLTKTTEKVFEEYRLGTDFDLVTSSTQALTAQEKANVDSGEHFVATMWQPYWATSAFGMKRLEDPKNVYGGDEGVHVMARAGAAEDYPEFTEWLEGFELTREECASLETLITIEYEDGQEQEALDEWLESHPGRLD